MKSVKRSVCVVVLLAGCSGGDAQSVKQLTPELEAQIAAEDAAIEAEESATQIEPQKKPGK